MKASKYLIVVIILFLIGRVLMAIFHISFTSVKGDQLFLFVVMLLAVITWALRTKFWDKRLLITGSAIAIYYVLFNFIAFIDKHLMDGERELQAFKNTDLLIYEQFGFGIGSGPYVNIGGGKTYLWGLLFKEEFSTTIYSEGPPPIPEEYQLPKELEDQRECCCWFWRERGWAFDFSNNKLYKLKKRF